MAKRLLPMVISGINWNGLWFRDTIYGYSYVFHWNPFKTIRNLINGNLYLGFFPFLSKHIRFK